MTIELPAEEEQTNFEKIAINDCITFLLKEPTVLSDFLEDMKVGKHKKWHLYRAAISNAKTKDMRGRAEPLRGGKSVSGAQATELARAYEKTRQHYIPILHLGYCHTPKEKILRINKSDCPPKIKAELIALCIEEQQELQRHKEALIL